MPIQLVALRREVGRKKREMEKEEERESEEERELEKEEERESEEEREMEKEEERDKSGGEWWREEKKIER